MKVGRALMVVLLLSPSLVFSADYLANSLASPGGMRQFTTTASDQGYSITLTMGYPSYVVSDQRVPVNVTLRFNFTAPYTAVGINDVKVDLRNPSTINGTTNVVEDWLTLSSGSAQVGRNYSSSGTFSSSIPVVAAPPPSGNPLDLFVPATKFGINGATDITLYSNDSASGPTATPLAMSFLDSQTVYQTQLSLMRSTTSFIAYQLVAALLVSLIYLRTRSAGFDLGEKRYFVQLESHRLQSSLAKLDGLRGAGKIGEVNYAELKQRISKELARIKGSD